MDSQDGSIIKKEKKRKIIMLLLLNEVSGSITARFAETFWRKVYI